jgi:signal transduction histidine kinase
MSLARSYDACAPYRQDSTISLTIQRRSGDRLWSDPSRLERMFDAFYTTKSSGMGMGLSICRSIIDAHGGQLWAEANEPRGAIFQFTLPSAENKLMNSLLAAPQNAEPHEDTV